MFDKYKTTMHIEVHYAVEAHSCADTNNKISLNVNKYSIAGRFDLKVFVNCLQGTTTMHILFTCCMMSHTSKMKNGQYIYCILTILS